MGMGPSAPVKGLALIGAWAVSSGIGEMLRRVDVGASGSSVIRSQVLAEHGEGEAMLGPER